MQHAHQVKRFLSMGNYNDSIKRSDNQDVGTAAKFSDDFLLPWTHWSLVLWVMWCWMTAHWTGWFEWQERHEGILSCEEQVVNSISLTSLPTKWHLILLYQYVCELHQQPLLKRCVCTDLPDNSCDGVECSAHHAHWLWESGRNYVCPNTPVHCDKFTVAAFNQSRTCWGWPATMQIRVEINPGCLEGEKRAFNWAFCRWVGEKPWPFVRAEFESAI